MKNEPILRFILAEIKRENSSRKDKTTMSQDADNERLVHIFHDASNKFRIPHFHAVVLEDDEEVLSDLFGQDGFDAIREAEAGLDENRT